jgi:hypothetical protein
MNTLTKQKNDFNRLKSTITTKLREKEEERQRLLRERLKQMAENKRLEAMADIEEALKDTKYKLDDLTERQMKELMHWFPRTKKAVRAAVTTRQPL